MSVFSHHFPVGLGTARLPVNGPTDTAGIEKSVQIVLRALEAGVDYVDVGYSYSAGMALRILREAFRLTKRSVSLTAKVEYGFDRTADDSRRRVELYLKAMGLDKISYFTCWTIRDFSAFEKIMVKGGIYDGALRMKEEGVIDHICCSLHASPADILKILAEDVFEGITISYSLLNANSMLPILDRALERGVGVSVMNPLGGGIIPQNRKYFSFACGEYDDGDTIHSALRFVKAHPAVNIVLSGANSVEELQDTLDTLSAPDTEPASERIGRVMKKVKNLSGFCTGCKYCDGCPQGIPTYAIMRARNALLFDPVASYNRTDPDELLYNLQIFRSLYYNDNWIPKSGDNPCVRCGRCEAQCTQKLQIMDGVDDTYRRIRSTCYSNAAHKARLSDLLVNSGYKTVGLYPSGGFSSLIMKLYRESFGEPEFEWVLFNSDSTMWGQMSDELIIHGPQDIPEIAPDVILVCSYRFDEQIFLDLQQYEKKGVKIIKLYRRNEMPWIF